MKYLLLTDDCTINEKLENSIKNLDKKNKIIAGNFETESLKKIRKNIEESVACFIISSDISFSSLFSKSDGNSCCHEHSETKIEGNAMENLVNLSKISGFCAACQVPIFTNVEILSQDSIFQKNSAKFFSSFDELIAFIQKNFQKILLDSRQRLAKKKLLDRGIPFTSDCFATYIAKNKIEVFNEFLEAGMSVNSRDDTGTPMLNIACRNDNFEFVEMLLDLGADLNAKSDDRGYTAVMDAVWRGNEKITKYLIEKGADLNTLNKEGQTNLILAVGADRLNIVKLLAENGSNPDVKDWMGMSAYNYATLFRKEKIVEILKPYHKEA